MENIKVEYKGIEISYNEENENWSCKVAEDKWFEKQTLKECKKRIDDFFKKEKAFDRFDAYLLSYQSIPGIVTVTSITDDRKQAWITFKDRDRREKVSVDSLRALSENNTTIISEVRANLDETNKLKEKCEMLLSSLERIKI